MVNEPLQRELAAEGWEERFTASGSRLAEAEAYYRSLGYEVRVEWLVDVAGAGRCTSCFAQPLADGPVGVIFTRGEPGAGAEEDDLYGDETAP